MTSRLGHEVAIEEFVRHIVGEVEAEEKKVRRSVIIEILALTLGLAALLLIYFLAR
jgi:hypothetical protein